MLLLIESSKAKNLAQESVEKNVRAKLDDQGLRNIGFPSGNIDEVIYANEAGELWAAFGMVDDVAIPRRWNVFGVFDPARNSQLITVEINIATDSNSAQVAGFFAKDPGTGQVYLMHGGRVGGGKPGVGRNAFLAWSKATLEDVYAADGTIRSGIVIGNVATSDLAGRIWHFVQLVRNFKDAVASGEMDSAEMRDAIVQWGEFNHESSGRRQGRRRSVLDYTSYHGEVVKLLYEERMAHRREDERVSNNRLIDLFVTKNSVMTEICEVKTSLDRQSIYTAIGQLFCHSIDGAQDIKRTLIVPEGQLPVGIEKCLVSHSISVRRFSISASKVAAVVLS